MVTGLRGVAKNGAAFLTGWFLGDDAGSADTAAGAGKSVDEDGFFGLVLVFFPDFFNLGNKLDRDDFPVGR